MNRKVYVTAYIGRSDDNILIYLILFSQSFLTLFFVVTERLRRLFRTFVDSYIYKFMLNTPNTFKLKYPSKNESTKLSIEANTAFELQRCIVTFLQNCSPHYSQMWITYCLLWIITTLQLAYFIGTYYLDFGFDNKVTDVFFMISVFLAELPFSNVATYVISLILIYSSVIFTFTCALLHYHLNFLKPFFVQYYVLTWIPSLLFVPLVIPHAQMIFPCFGYSPNTPYPSSFFPSLVCWEGTHTALVILSTITLTLFLSFCYITTRLFFNADVPNKNQVRDLPLNARTNNRAEASMLVLKCIIITLTVASNSSSWRYATSVILFLGGVVITIRHLRELPFWSDAAQAMSLFQSLFCAWVGVIGFLLLFLTDKEGVAMLFFVGIPLLALLAPIALHWRLHTVFAWDVTQMHSAAQFEIKTGRLLRGYWYSIAEFGDIYVEATPEIVKKRAEMVNMVGCLYEIAMQRFPTDADLHTSMAIFYTNVEYNRTMAYSAIRVAEQLRPSIDTAFQLFKVKKTLAERAHETSSHDVVAYTRFHALEPLAHDTTARAMLSLVQFWSELLDDRPDMERLASTGHAARTLISQAVEHFTTLLQLHPNSRPVLRAYAVLCLEITGDHTLALQLLQKADELASKSDQVPEEVPHSELLRSSAATVDIFDERNGVVSMSVAPATLGIITSANPVFTKLLGYQNSGNLVGKKINCILPKPISTVHDACILNYLATKKSNVVDQVRLVTAVTRTGHLALFHMHVCWADEVQGNMIAVMQPVPCSNNLCFLVDADTLKLTYTTPNLTDVLGVSLRAVTIGRVHLHHIIPSLAAEDSDDTSGVSKALFSQRGLVYTATHAVTGAAVSVHAFMQRLMVLDEVFLLVHCTTHVLTQGEDEAAQAERAEEGRATRITSPVSILTPTSHSLVHARSMEGPLPSPMRLRTPSGITRRRSVVFSDCCDDAIALPVDADVDGGIDMNTNDRQLTRRSSLPSSAAHTPTHALSPCMTVNTHTKKVSTDVVASQNTTMRDTATHNTAMHRNATRVAPGCDSGFDVDVSGGEHRNGVGVGDGVVDSDNAAGVAENCDTASVDSEEEPRVQLFSTRNTDKSHLPSPNPGMQDLMKPDRAVLGLSLVVGDGYTRDSGSGGGSAGACGNGSRIKKEPQPVYPHYVATLDTTATAVISAAAHATSPCIPSTLAVQHTFTEPTTLPDADASCSFPRMSSRPPNLFINTDPDVEVMPRRQHVRAHAPSLLSPSHLTPLPLSPSSFLSPSLLSPSYLSPSLFSPSLFSPSTLRRVSSSDAHYSAHAHSFSHTHLSLHAPTPHTATSVAPTCTPSSCHADNTTNNAGQAGEGDASHQTLIRAQQAMRRHRRRLERHTRRQLTVAILTDAQVTARKLQWMRVFTIVLVISLCVLAAAAYVLVEARVADATGSVGEVYRSSLREAYMSSAVFHFRFLQLFYRLDVTEDVLFYFYRPATMHSTSEQHIFDGYMAELERSLSEFEALSDIDRRPARTQALHALRATASLELLLLDNDKVRMTKLSLLDAMAQLSAYTRNSMHMLYATDKEDPGFFFALSNGISGLRTAAQLNASLLYAQVKSFHHTIITVLTCMFVLSIAMILLISIVLIAPLVQRVESAKDRVLDVFLSIPRSTRQSLRRKAFKVLTLARHDAGGRKGPAEGEEDGEHDDEYDDGYARASDEMSLMSQRTDVSRYTDTTGAGTSSVVSGHRLYGLYNGQVSTSRQITYRHRRNSQPTHVTTKNSREIVPDMSALKAHKHPPFSNSETTLPSPVLYKKGSITSSPFTPFLSAPPSRSPSLSPIHPLLHSTEPAPSVPLTPVSSASCVRGPAHMSAKKDVCASLRVDRATADSGSVSGGCNAANHARVGAGADAMSVEEEACMVYALHDMTPSLRNSATTSSRGPACAPMDAVGACEGSGSVARAASRNARGTRHNDGCDHDCTENGPGGPGGRDSRGDGNVDDGDSVAGSIATGGDKVSSLACNTAHDDDSHVKRRSLLCRGSVHNIAFRFLVYFLLVVAYYSALLVWTTTTVADAENMAEVMMVAGKRAPAIQMAFFFATHHILFNQTEVKAQSEFDASVYAGDFQAVGFENIAAAQLAQSAIEYGSEAHGIVRSGMSAEMVQFTHGNICGIAPERYDELIPNFTSRYHYIFVNCETYKDGILTKGLYQLMWYVVDAISTVLAGPSKLVAYRFIPGVPPPNLPAPAIVSIMMMWFEVNGLFHDYFAPLLHMSSTMYRETIVLAYNNYSHTLASLLIAFVCVNMAAYVLLFYRASNTLVEASKKTKNMMLLLPPSIICYSRAAQEYIKDNISSV